MARPVFATADWHVGDPRFLFRSLFATFKEVRKKKPLCVVVGDLLTGVGVFRGQEKEALPENYQVYAAAYVLAQLDKLLGRTKWLLLHGNHDRGRSREPLTPLVAAVARDHFRLSVRYVGEELFLPLPVGGVLFHHGFGYSRSSPQSPSFRQDMTLRALAYARQGKRIHRICHGHTHWLSAGLRYGELFFDSVGGFQRYVRDLLSRAPLSPPGGILYEKDAVLEVPAPEDVLAEELASPEDVASLYLAAIRSLKRG